MTYLEAHKVAENQSFGLIDQEQFYAVCFKGLSGDKDLARYFILNPNDVDRYSNMSLWHDVLDDKLERRLRTDLDYRERVQNVGISWQPLFFGDGWIVVNAAALVKHARKELGLDDSTTGS